MPKPKVLRPHGLFEPARKILEESCEVEYWAQAGVHRGQNIQASEGQRRMVCLLNGKVSEELLRAAPKLRMRECGGGIRHIDVAACTKRGVMRRIPGVRMKRRRTLPGH